MIRLLFAVVLCCGAYSAAFASLYDIDYRTNHFVVEDSEFGHSLRLNYRAWVDESASDVIVYLSGMQSHSQWFNETGDYFASMGFNVYALDRRGSGLSWGRRGHIHTAFQWISDMAQFIGFVRQQNPGKPLHLMSNSFGARLTMAYAIAFPEQVDSLILIAPGTHMQVSLPPEQMVKTLFHVRKYFPTPLQDELFTSDPERLDFMAQDELGLRQVTANLYKMGEFLNTGNLMTPRLQRLTMPVLVLLSQQDKILDVPAVIAGLYNRLETQKKLVTYEDVEHFLLFEEAVRQDVLDEITHWIDTFDHKP